MEVLILIVIGLMVLGCWEFRVVGVAKIDDNAKVAKSKILQRPTAQILWRLTPHRFLRALMKLKLSTMVGQEG